MSREDSNNYKEIFLSDAPMIDLRAPCEYLLGAFPASINLPLMNDQEREKVGICYKKQGKEAAIELGHQLVQGAIKDQRIAEWKTFAKDNMEKGYFYCFRGGLRSRTSQVWLRETGVDFPIIEGGYKAMRRYLIDSTEQIVGLLNINLITGLTGSAKTKVINQIENSIDLEGLANHRGSSFGRQLTPQPTQINFENRLSIELLKYQNNYAKSSIPLYLEDESRLIGSRSIPLILKEKMDLSPLVLIEENFEYRVEQIFEDYVVDLNNQFEKVDKQQSVDLYQCYLMESTNKIKKRLGGVGFTDMCKLISQAIEKQKKSSCLNLHKEWIRYLLKNYYDAMYQFQLKKKQSRIIFKGDTVELMTYIQSNK